ncbi:MAG: hypothetical protein IJO46_10035, partial [Thermoguttaceae bacterium]|nr:hypothetical protein [Thermoguttaceae bacterium]
VLYSRYDSKLPKRLVFIYSSPGAYDAVGGSARLGSSILHATDRSTQTPTNFQVATLFTAVDAAFYLNVVDAPQCDDGGFASIFLGVVHRRPRVSRSA